MEVLVVSGCVKVVRLLSPMRLSDSPDPSCTFALIRVHDMYDGILKLHMIRNFSESSCSHGLILLKCQFMVNYLVLEA